MSIFTDVSDAPAGQPDGDLDLIKMIGEQFVARKDVKAIERANGAWNPVTDTGKADGKRLPFTLTDFKDHLAGRKTYGHYLVNDDNMCKLFAFDIDLDQEGWFIDMHSGADDTSITDLMAHGVKCAPREVWAAQDPPEAVEYFTMALRGLADGFAYLIHDLSDGKVHPIVADSGGKGLHVYGLTGLMPAKEVREFARSVLTHFSLFKPTRGDNFWKHTLAGSHQNLTVEVFPKQDTLDGKDLGNLMRLPLGVNQKTGRRGRFLTTKAQQDRLVEMDPRRCLTHDLPWE